MKNPTFPKDHNIIPKLFFNSTKFRPAPNSNVHIVEDNTLKKMCELTGVDYVEQKKTNQNTWL